MTDDLPNPALLPAGLRDLLPPVAETAAAAVEGLMDVSSRTAISGSSRRCWSLKPACWLVQRAVAEQTFRLMDPDSQRMMGLRADTTPQVARIATTRPPTPLAHPAVPTPQCLRTRSRIAGSIAQTASEC